MLRRALLFALIAVLAVPIAAQVQTGWKVRIDGSHGASAPDATPTLKIRADGKGLPRSRRAGRDLLGSCSTVKGVYAVEATFTLLKPSSQSHRLRPRLRRQPTSRAPTPTYVYFTIAQDGTFQVRHRAGNEVHDMEKSLHFAIRKPDASGKSTNTLEVQVAPTAVSYLINGAVVHATPTRAGTGSYTETRRPTVSSASGSTIEIDLQVDAFELKSPFTPPQRGQ